MKLTHLPEDLRITWPKLVYERCSADRVFLVEESLQLLEHPALSILHKQYTKKVFQSLYAVVKIIPEIEKRISRVIFCLKGATSQNGRSDSAAGCGSGCLHLVPKSAGQGIILV